MTEEQIKNREALIAYFEAGCKSAQTLGFELEHILLHQGTNTPVSYTETGGIRDVLEHMAPSYRSVSYEGGNIVGMNRCRETISIEPAGQLEISAGPYESVAQVQAGYEKFSTVLQPILDEYGLYAPFVGYNPATCARDLELVPKKRYESMTKFLGQQAYSAICMMRGTASLQVSVDYASEKDALLKLRVAEKLGPILALMCDNSPIFEGQPTSGHMARTGVWAGMWQDRVGIVPGSLDAQFSFAEYANYILTRQAILIPNENGEDGWQFVGGKTFDEIYAHKEMSQQEIEHALSMVWPDARLKNFVEIRPADAMPPAYAFAYTALIHTLFYNNELLEWFDSELAAVDEDSIRSAKEALMEQGYGAHVYGKPAHEWADELMEKVQAAANPEDLAYLAPLAKLVATRQTLAEGVHT